MIQMLYAQGAGAAPGAGSSWMSFLPLVLMIVIFYFLLIRPQQKKEKDRQKMIAALQKGDRVVTTGGMYGVIDSFGPNETVFLKVSGTTKIEFNKNAIQGKI
jgi:preprotein translocase subunit YajC